jgi:hypothetical protein
VDPNGDPVVPPIACSKTGSSPRKNSALSQIVSTNLIPEAKWEESRMVAAADLAMSEASAAVNSANLASLAGELEKNVITWDDIETMADAWDAAHPRQYLPQPEGIFPSFGFPFPPGAQQPFFQPGNPFQSLFDHGQAPGPVSGPSPRSYIPPNFWNSFNQAERDFFSVPGRMNTVFGTSESPMFNPRWQFSTK